MTMRRLMQVAAITAVGLIMAASASASTITFNTNAAGTDFVSSGTLTLNSNGGSAATLVFNPQTSSTTGVPSNINFGDMLLACPTCGTQASGLGTHFNAFTFDMIVTDVTDGGAMGEFVGTSTGGSVWSDVS